MPLITEMLARGKTYSFEFFPPKDDKEQRQLLTTIHELEPLKPSFVSVTYRGGAASRTRTTAVVADLAATTSLTPMAHLTCRAHPRTELVDVLNGFRAVGVQDLLALGGDPLPEQQTFHDLKYASQLVALGRAQGYTSIGVAAHPAGHPRSPDLRSDRTHLAAKLRQADFAITQFFFRLDEYVRLRDEMAALGVHKPIVAGIMPIVSLTSVQRMAQLSGYVVPADIVRRITAGGDDPAEIRARGIDHAADLCAQLLDAGVPGLHFYTLNYSKATREVYAKLGLVPA
jgi:methylenetetrahydrofolate reductase (NADPH)